MTTTPGTTLSDDELDRRLHGIYHTMVPRIVEHSVSTATAQQQRFAQLDDGSVVELALAGSANQQGPRRSQATIAMRLTAAAAAVLVVFAIAQRGTNQADEAPSAQPEPAPSSPSTFAPVAGEAAPPISVNGNAASSIDDLLYPPSDAIVTEAFMSPAIPGRWAATVVSPEGSAFGALLLENFWGELPVEYKQRTIGDNVFGVGDEDGRAVYVTLRPCLQLGISDDRTGLDAPDTQIDAVLDSVTIIGSDVVLNLPDGWTSLGVGPTNDVYSISFDTSISDQTRRAELRQMPDVNLGTLLHEARLAVIMLVDFDGTNAWIVAGQDPGVDFVYLAWQGDNGAIMLGLQDGSEAELTDLARSLETGHGADWSNAVGDVTTGTIAPNETTEGGCATRTLDVNR
jgi:hypothetical protein